MAPTAYTVAQAAALAGVSPSSVRNWCGQFAGHLSSGASPAPGQERLLSPADVAILQQIAQWRSQRQGYDLIAQQLAALPTNDLQPYVDVEPVEEPIEEPAPLQPAPLQPTNEAITALALVAAIDSRYSRLETRIEELEHKQVSRVTSLGWGVIIGLSLALVVFALVLALR